jgi:Sigma-70 region 3/Sigma-70, region 4
MRTGGLIGASGFSYAPTPRISLISTTLTLAQPHISRLPIDGVPMRQDMHAPVKIAGIMFAATMVGFLVNIVASYRYAKITRGIADKDRLIRLPVHIIESLAKLRRLRRRLSASLLGAEPDPRELAVHVGWTVEKVRLLLSVSNDAVLIDAPVRDAADSSLGDLLRSSASPDPEQILAEREQRRRIDAVVNEPGGVTTEVIRLRFGIGTPDELTLQETGDRKGVTRERIRQIESKGLGSLRRKSGALRHFRNEGRCTKKERETLPVLNETERDGKVAQRTRGAGGDGVLASLFDRLSKPCKGNPDPSIWLGRQGTGSPRKRRPPDITNRGVAYDVPATYTCLLKRSLI